MKLYNTLTRKKEVFIPIKDKEVSIYICGPTVYNYIHVGNARPMVIFDTLRRYFLYKDYKVNFIVNFTDIDDKMINKAKEENTSVKAIADRYIEAFLQDAKGLNLYEEKTVHPKATDYIYQMIKFIKELEEKGAAYNVNGNVYFDVSKAEDYGKLSKKNLEDLISGARVEINQEKKSPADFVLWKNKKEDEPYWDSPWGQGRPGWHIECSVMARALLGDTIDIHGGGEDLQFPHHENEIAQSETLTGKPLANYWLHNSMITVDDEKMSKSKGNFFTIYDIKQEYDLEVVRLFLLSAHYRSPINFSQEIMDQNKNALDRLYNGKNNLEFLLDRSQEKPLTDNEVKIKESLLGCKDDFEKSMEDDINTADGVSSLFNIVRLANTNLNEASSKSLIEFSLDILMELANVLGLLFKEEDDLEKEILEAIDRRNKARANKDFVLADKIRDELKSQGILLEDTSDGVKWKKI